jgi:glycosyltransferase involved in cell wall biosynthesis
VRIAVFHNRYALRGGEDGVVDFEVELLRKAGHEVHLLLADSGDLRAPVERLRAGLDAGFSRRAARRVAALLDAHPVDVGHVHNFFPLLSPAVHETLHARGVAVVQTLHNYRLVCAAGTFLRDGRPCEDCAARGPWNAVRHGCYRGSRLQTAAWARATAHGRRSGVWQRCVDRFVAPSAFLARKLAAAGLPAERVRVKGNAVPDPGAPRPPGRGGVFVGRLSPEKGVRLLLEAWRGLGDVPLAIVGEGPEEAALRRLAADLPGVRFSGRLSAEGVQEELARAAFGVVPSLWYENFPRVVAEAFAAGRPVVGARETALAELVEPERTGLLFDRGDATSLARACRRLSGDAALCARLGREARRHYEDHWTPAHTLEQLERIYAEAARSTARRRQAASASGV